MLRKALTALGGLGIALGVISVVPPATALAYPPCQTSSTASVSSPTVGPGGQVTFTVTFTDCNGGAVSGSQVTFSFSGPPNCHPTFNPPSGVTDKNGQVTTTVTFPANCPGQYTLSAATQGITVTAGVRETGGFPNTTGDPAGGQTPLPVGAMLVAALGIALVLTGSVALLARRRQADLP